MRVVLTGPESTGKTELAGILARALDAPLSDEYAREYAESHPALGPDDVEPIARGQIANEDRARAEAESRRRPLVVHDTDLVSTVVYARHYYGDCPAWIVAAARARRADLYLLCVPDTPFEPDAVRDTPEARDALFTEFRAALDALGAEVVEISGDWAARERAARAAVEARHPGLHVRVSGGLKED
ncbi:hypothetical protein J421_0953 [Gemmatirosa kalamazoonensis]|uniref:NadR/Ttd14 AAA domain-containing protein n=1 Tax=Gemmatirosa kalamazoonensis TaxID=861299 RepID=W0RDT5_9BACT|nr:ATP-binding protein [Gemmatirosa kalamazoonensis]AHG88490.1 hypothetical protein J421_0953 [Gemmatirosa kalamazoonensis]